MKYLYGLLFVSFTLCCSGQSFDLRVLIEMQDTTYATVWQIGNYIVGEKNIDLKTQKEIKINFRKKYGYTTFAGIVENKILGVKKNNDKAFGNALAIDLKNDAVEPRYYSKDTHGAYALDYQNGIVFYTYLLEFSGESTAYNTKDGTEKEIKGRIIYDISPDRQHTVGGIGGLYVYNISENTIIKEKDGEQYKVGEWTGLGSIHEYPIRFLTNSLFYSMNIEGKKDYCIWNLGIYKVATVEFKVRGEYWKILGFFGDLRYALASSSKYKKTCLVDTTPFRNWLDKKGFLFKKTTGAVLDDNLRVREYANLDAKIFGVLKKGQQVEVLDKSGGRTKVENMNEYWYKIKTKEGLEGWVYGGYLKVDEKS